MLVWRKQWWNFPRIRGDGPSIPNFPGIVGQFSPYSRGWSQVAALNDAKIAIFPVFAGMVPRGCLRLICAVNFPRIRGDGPLSPELPDFDQPFSPYSRGWSGGGW